MTLEVPTRPRRTGRDRVGRSQALRNLADRTDVPDLRHFVLAIVQAEGCGIPVADALRIQAAELRVKRRQRAEEWEMKIPVKVIFPLILCILPTLFLVILGPAVIKISRELFGAGGAFRDDLPAPTSSTNGTGS